MKALPIKKVPQTEKDMVSMLRQHITQHGLRPSIVERPEDAILFVFAELWFENADKGIVFKTTGHISIIAFPVEGAEQTVWVALKQVAGEKVRNILFTEVGVPKLYLAPGLPHERLVLHVAEKEGGEQVLRKETMAASLVVSDSLDEDDAHRVVEGEIMSLFMTNE